MLHVILCLWCLNSVCMPNSPLLSMVYWTSRLFTFTLGSVIPHFHLKCVSLIFMFHCSFLYQLVFMAFERSLIELIYHIVICIDGSFIWPISDSILVYQSDVHYFVRYSVSNLLNFQCAAWFNNASKSQCINWTQSFCYKEHAILR